MDICLKKEGANSEFLAMSYFNQADLDIAQNHDEDAIPLLKHALQICDKSPNGPEHTMDIVGKLGTAYEVTGKIPEAKAQFCRYYDMAAAVMGLNSKDPKTVALIEDFAAHERRTRRLRS